MPASIEAVCVVHEIIDGYYHPTAIDKRPVGGAVAIGELGPEGDQHVDKSHGGPDAAVYVYAAEDAAYFAASLDREIPPGLFGDNVRTRGLDVTRSRLGERWWLGEPGTGVLLEVRKPRTPCLNFSMRMGIDGFHVDFNRTGRVGAMCRVLQTGSRPRRRPDHRRARARPRGHDRASGHRDDAGAGAGPARLRRLADVVGAREGQAVRRPRLSRLSTAAAPRRSPGSRTCS